MAWYRVIWLMTLLICVHAMHAKTLRSHNHGPDWVDHCWTETGVIKDPFCALLITTTSTTSTTPSNTQTTQRITTTSTQSMTTTSIPTLTTTTFRPTSAQATTTTPQTTTTTHATSTTKIETSSLQAWMTSSVATSTASQPCYDVDPHCDRYGRDYICSPNVRNWAQQNCARYCGLCISATYTVTQRPTTTDRNMRPTLCKVCSGPVQLCEFLHHTTTCEYPNNICLNHIVNEDSGKRTVDRRCGNYQTCYRERVFGSSDSDRCQQFKQEEIHTLAFECTYCCTEDGCNAPVRPEQSTLMG